MISAAPDGVDPGAADDTDRDRHEVVPFERVPRASQEPVEDLSNLPRQEAN